MLKEFENVTTVSNCTKCEDMVVSQDGHALSLLRQPLLLSLIPILDMDFTGLWLHLPFLSSLLFSCQSLSSFFLARVTVCVKKCQCTQLFVNRIFNCIQISSLTLRRLAINTTMSNCFSLSPSISHPGKSIKELSLTLILIFLCNSKLLKCPLLLYKQLLYC